MQVFRSHEMVEPPSQQSKAKPRHRKPVKTLTLFITRFNIPLDRLEPTDQLELLPVIKHQCVNFNPKKIVTFQDLIILVGYNFKIFRVKDLDLEELFEFSFQISPHNMHFTEGVFVGSGFHGGTLITMDFGPREAPYTVKGIFSNKGEMKEISVQAPTIFPSLSPHFQHGNQSKIIFSDENTRIHCIPVAQDENEEIEIEFAPFLQTLPDIGFGLVNPGSYKNLNSELYEHRNECVLLKESFNTGKWKFGDLSKEEAKAHSTFLKGEKSEAKPGLLKKILNKFL